MTGKGLFITGTDTGVGKTIVSAGILTLLRSRGINACYFKPALTGAERINGELFPEDTELVKAIAGLDEKNENITPFIFERAASPHFAARLENRPIKKNSLLQAFQKLQEKYEFILAEGCGGIAVPLNDEGYLIADFIRDSGLPCIITARAGLGTLNHTLLTVEFARQFGIAVKGIILNGFTGTDIEKDNLNSIEKLTNLPILGTIPWMGENFSIRKNKKAFMELFVKNWLEDLC
jgi:dethiobiotin synthetase